MYVAQLYRPLVQRDILATAVGAVTQLQDLVHLQARGQGRVQGSHAGQEAGQGAGSRVHIAWQGSWVQGSHVLGAGRAAGFRVHTGG